MFGCNNLSDQKTMKTEQNILFLHHSTGKQIWKGGVNKIIYKFFKTSNVQKWFELYNKTNKTNYKISDRIFPKKQPYGWNNYPFDYYNIWIKHAGLKPYMEEQTLELLTKDFDIIIWKHCYPVGMIKEQNGTPDINSPIKTLENYKLQYNALKEKMHQFPDTKFLVWTGASLVKEATTNEQATRTKEFFNWVRHDWDEKGDNIYLWDFYALQTNGDLYFKDEFARSIYDSHPSDEFAEKVYPLFCQRIVDIIDGNGDNKSITGMK